jgi:hypothetical protein
MNSNRNNKDSIDLAQDKSTSNRNTYLMACNLALYRLKES